MRGKVVGITGGTSGIGQVAAERLASMGARLVLVARDRARGEAAMTRLRERSLDAAHAIHHADLSANSLHPGFVATRFGDESGGLLADGVRLAKLLSAISPEKGADTIVYLASSPDVEGVSDQYFYKRRATRPSREAEDDDAAGRLWSATEALAGA